MFQCILLCRKLIASACFLSLLFLFLCSAVCFAQGQSHPTVIFSTSLAFNGSPNFGSFPSILDFLGDVGTKQKTVGDLSVMADYRASTAHLTMNGTIDLNNFKMPSGVAVIDEVVDGYFSVYVRGKAGTSFSFHLTRNEAGTASDNSPSSSLALPPFGLPYVIFDQYTSTDSLLTGSGDAYDSVNVDQTKSNHFAEDKVFSGKSSNPTVEFNGETYSLAVELSVSGGFQYFFLSNYSDSTATAHGNFSIDVKVDKVEVTPLPSLVAPTNLTVTPASSTKLNLAWNYGSDPIDGFKIERKSGTGDFVEIGSAGTGVTTFPDTGLTPGTSYTYRVRTFKGSDYSGYSTEAAGQTRHAVLLKKIDWTSNHTFVVSVQRDFGDVDPLSGTGGSGKIDITISPSGLPYSTSPVERQTNWDNQDHFNHFLDDKPIEVDVQALDVPRFRTNQRFTLTVSAHFNGVDDSDTREMTVLLPVVIIPGIQPAGPQMGGDGTYGDLEQYLHDTSYNILNDNDLLGTEYNVRNGASYPTVYTLSYRTNYASFLEGAGALFLLINEVKEKTWADTVNLIGHSKGGLVGRQYVVQHPGDIRQFIMSATPNLGSVWAYTDSIARFYDYQNLYPIWNAYRNVSSQRFISIPNRELENLNNIPLPTLPPFSNSQNPYAMLYSTSWDTPTTYTLVPPIRTGRPIITTSPGDAIVPAFSVRGERADPNNPAYPNENRPQILAFRNARIDYMPINGLHFTYLSKDFFSNTSQVLQAIFGRTTGDIIP